MMNFTNTDRMWFNKVFWQVDSQMREQVLGQPYSQVEDQVHWQVKWLMFIQTTPIRNTITQEIDK
jgi:hypothetical protein